MFEQLADATISTLICACADEVFAGSLARRSAGAMPNARYVKISDADYLAAQACIDVVLPMITAFLREVARQPADVATSLCSDVIPTEVFGTEESRGQDCRRHSPYGEKLVAPFLPMEGGEDRYWLMSQLRIIMQSLAIGFLLPRGRPRCAPVGMTGPMVSLARKRD